MPRMLNFFYGYHIGSVFFSLRGHFLPITNNAFAEIIRVLLYILLKYGGSQNKLLLGHPVYNLVFKT